MIKLNTKEIVISAGYLPFVGSGLSNSLESDIFSINL